MPIDFLKQNILLIALVATSGGMLLWPLIFRSGAKAVSAAEATMLINREEAVVLDVRSAAEFAEGKVAELTDAEDKVILVRTKHSKRIVDGAEKTYTNVDGMHMYARDDAKAAELINKAKGAKKADDKFKAL